MASKAKDQLKNAREGAAAEAKGNHNPKPHVATNGAWSAPGRLGNPTMELKDEPRLNANLQKFFSALGMDKHVPPQKLAELSENSSMDDIAAMIEEFESGLMVLYDNPNVLSLELPEDANEVKVEQTEQTIKGGDGQDMKVYIYRPAGQKESLPGVFYTHGGGMVLVPTMNPVHDRWCRSIAAQNTVVIMPDFRNAWTKQGYNPFPAGLNDSATAFKWAIANKDTLRIRNLITTGESGGGNLASAIALKANREGWVKDVAGVYAIVPYISNAYGWSQERKLKELPSLVECNHYFLSSHPTAFLAYFYTPNDETTEDPLAWPYYATEQDMKGLPPHVVVADELDMLRDEGVSYARRLAKAGVQAKGAVNLGVTHGTSLIFRSIVPQYNKRAVQEIATFAKELSQGWTATVAS